MRTINVNLYQFDELSDVAKQEAITELYDINIDHNWWKFIYEDAKTVGLLITGFDVQSS